MLSLEHVSAGYGGFQALFGVSLEVRAGDEVEGRALARAVRADEAEDLALGHVEGNAAYRSETAKAFSEL